MASKMTPKKIEKTDKKHVSPSRAKYEKNHPVISFRLSKEDITFLRSLGAKGESFSHIVKRILKDNEGLIAERERALSEAFSKDVEALKIDFERKEKKSIERGHKEGYDRGHKEGYEEGYNQGYEEAKKEFRIWYFCADCGKELTLHPNSEAHKVVIDCLKGGGYTNRIRYVCNECYKK